MAAIGQGSYSSVFKVKNYHDENIYAAKVINKTGF